MKVVTFGEALFRLSTKRGERLRRAQELQFYLGGSELNIAANLQSLGVPSAWVSLLPDGMTGELIQSKLEDLKIDITHTQIIPHGRPGFYLMESGSEPRPDVVLNRYASSMAQEKTFSFDWKKILQGASVYHTSGITAGLSQELTQEVKRSLEIARAANVLTSYDFNFRKNIWTLEEFKSRQKDLLPLIDILFCSESDLDLFFGTGVKWQEIFAQTKLKYLVINRRSASDTGYGLDVVTPDLHRYESRRYTVTNLDRIGVGDSMAAGFLAGLLKTQDYKQAAEWASLAGALKYSVTGDMALLEEKELRHLLETGTQGIRR